MLRWVLLKVISYFSVIHGFLVFQYGSMRKGLLGVYGVVLVLFVVVLILLVVLAPIEQYLGKS